MWILMTDVQLRNKTLSCLAAIAVLLLTSCSTMPFNSAGMYRGSLREGEPPFIAIYPTGDSK